MRWRTSIVASVITLFCGALSSEAAPIISIQPSAATIQKGDLLTVVIGIGLTNPTTVDDVTDLYAYQLGVHFDPSVIQIDAVSEGSFLGTFGGTFFVPGVIDNVTGTLLFSANTILGAQLGASGEGALLTIVMVGVATGDSPLEIMFDPLNGDALLDSSLNAITFGLEGAFVTVADSSVPLPEPHVIFLVGVAFASILRTRISGSRRHLPGIKLRRPAGVQLLAAIAVAAYPFLHPHEALAETCGVAAASHHTIGLQWDQPIHPAGAFPWYDTPTTCASSITIVGNQPWLKFSVSSIPGAGQFPSYTRHAVTLQLEPNETPNVRSGRLDVLSNGIVQMSTVIFQFPKPSCTYSVAPSTLTLERGPNTGSILVTAVPNTSSVPLSSCTWTASSGAPWIVDVNPISGQGSGSVSFAATANTGGTARTGSLRVAGKTISVTQNATFCESGVYPVVLPQHQIPWSSLVMPEKPWRIGYGELPLMFTVTDEGTHCRAVSNIGHLPVIALDLASLVSVHFADSVANATLDVYEAGGAVPPIECQFSKFPGSGVNNNCLLNAFAAGARYARWSTDGFTTLLRIPDFLGGPKEWPWLAGPYSFWVNLDDLGVSSDASIGAVLNTVEPYIHTTLVGNLSAVDKWALIQDPGAVNLAVVSASGQTTGRLPDGRITTDIPGSFYLASDTHPAVLLLGSASSGRIGVVIHGRTTGEYDLGIASAYTQQQDVAGDLFSGSISQGQSLGFAAIFSSQSLQQTSMPAVFRSGDLNLDEVVSCTDLAIIRAAFGRRTGQPGFNAWADVVADGIINIRDLAFVSQRLPAGTRCQ